MIWLWLRACLAFLLRLLVPPGSWVVPPLDRVIDSNAPCPACGARKGVLKFVRSADSKMAIAAERNPMIAVTMGNPVVSHTCQVCGFVWGDRPVSVPEIPIS